MSELKRATPNVSEITALMDGKFVRRGRGEPPIPLSHGMEIISMKGCPDCGGRGWFLIHPFATGGSNGAGGVQNTTQCLTCADAAAYWEKHNCLPPGLELAGANHER